jgi:anti-anti-sigma factor
MGRMDSNSAREVEAVLLPFFDKEGPVLFDFSALDYISSAGLRVMLLGAKRSKASKVIFALCGMSNAVSEVFKISGCAKLFAIYPDRETAIRALAPGPGELQSPA